MIKQSPIYQSYMRHDGRRLSYWSIGLGVLLTALGLIASVNLYLVSIATTLVIGAVMLVGGIAQIVHAVCMSHWPRARAWAAAGVLYLLAGVVVLIAPLTAAAFLTLMLVLLLGTSGVFRLGYAISEHAAGWAWTLVSGLFSIAAAIFIAMGWPADATWVLGLILSVDLLVQGIMFMGFGFAVRSALAA